MSPIFGVRGFIAFTIINSHGVLGNQVGCPCPCPDPNCTCFCGDSGNMMQYSSTGVDVKEESRHLERKKMQSFLPKLADKENSDDGSDEGYKEELVPVEEITGTNLFTGLAYRLHHEYYGQAPIIASEIPEDLQVRGSNSGPWHKFGYRIVAERRPSEWPKYGVDGASEFNALFMFIRAREGNTYLLINVAAASRYPKSSVCDWTFSRWNTRPTTAFPHSLYCRDEMEEGCAYITNTETHTWELIVDENEKIYHFKKPGQELYLGFKFSEGVAYMGLFKDRNRGRIQAELAGSQLSGTIIHFNIERGKFENIQNVSLIETHDIINNSSRNLTQTFSVSKSVTNTFSFQFSQTLKIFASLTVRAGISLFGVVNLVQANTVGGSVSVTSSHQWTTTTIHTYSVNQVVNIRPFRRVTVEGTMEMADNVEKPFVAQMLAKMTVVRLTLFSREIAREIFPRWKLREYLDKYVKGKYIRDSEDGVLYETKGTVRGSFGISTNLTVKDFAV